MPGKALSVHLGKEHHQKGRDAPKERQSRAVRGRVKLNAKMMNTRAFIITSDQ
jgi:hypothetical protein